MKTTRAGNLITAAFIAAVTFALRGGKAVLVRLPEVVFSDDKGDKPVGINVHIGRRPVMAFGDSNGDQQMLEYTQGGGGARFELLVLHDDAAREFAYGPARGLPDVRSGGRGLTRCRAAWVARGAGAAMVSGRKTSSARGRGAGSSSLFEERWRDDTRERRTARNGGGGNRTAFAPAWWPRKDAGSTTL